MNTLVIVLIAAVLLSCAYVFYGRWLANKWGIDPKAETPAKKFEDGKDYVPTDGWTVFSHQFSSIAGAGPVTGAIQAAVFGWVPVFLWIIVGGIFFGAVTDFGALYASVKNEGKSMGLLIEKYIGKFGRKVFLLFCWLFTLLVIAAFADMVAGTFNAYTEVDGVVKLADAAKTNGAAGTISLLFIVFARGWYWCKDCGYEKPEDYQYIEIAKVNPRAVICMDSAAWLAGMLKEEPATIAVATARTDRKKMDLENFEIRRFYFQNADVPGEICEKKTEFGSYKYYSPKRTFCDCLHMNNKMPEEVKEEILTWCRKQKYSKEEILEYANKLRAVKNIEEEYQK